jgi:hypothetical protein
MAIKTVESLEWQNAFFAHSELTLQNVYLCVGRICQEFVNFRSLEQIKHYWDWQEMTKRSYLVHNKKCKKLNWKIKLAVYHQIRLFFTTFSLLNDDKHLSSISKGKKAFQQFSLRRKSKTTRWKEMTENKQDEKIFCAAKKR